ncbi:MAG: hypothetical protein ACTIDN_04285 [Acetobacter sp.]|uniref:hypothetical protein n=1 Tax=Acetobacter sp. TaxID=440 RepID=UPI003F902620
MSKPSVSRRGVLGASLVAAVTTVPAIASTNPAEGQDAALLDVLARYWQAERAILAIEAEAEPPATSPAYLAWETKFDALISQRSKAIAQMADLRAMTAEGQQGKATVLERHLPLCLRWYDCGDDPEIKLALSLARDVAGNVLQ